MSKDKKVYGRTTDEVEAKSRAILKKRGITLSEYIHKCLLALIERDNRKRERK